MQKRWKRVGIGAIIVLLIGGVIATITVFALRSNKTKSALTKATVQECVQIKATTPSSTPGNKLQKQLIYGSKPRSSVATETDEISKVKIEEKDWEEFRNVINEAKKENFLTTFVKKATFAQQVCAIDALVKASDQDFSNLKKDSKAILQLKTMLAKAIDQKTFATAFKATTQRLNKLSKALEQFAVARSGKKYPLPGILIAKEGETEQKFYNVSMFHYSPDEGRTFNTFLKRFSDRSSFLPLIVNEEVSLAKFQERVGKIEEASEKLWDTLQTLLIDQDYTFRDKAGKKIEDGETPVYSTSTETTLMVNMNALKTVRNKSWTEIVTTYLNESKTAISEKTPGVTQTLHAIVNSVLYEIDDDLKEIALWVILRKHLEKNELTFLLDGTLVTFLQTEKETKNWQELSERAKAELKSFFEKTDSSLSKNIKRFKESI